uniref:Uncharacterized protein n=1 Tax=Anguilla anguilla TaxID=7936 RepID=A0A0E9W8U0_ANGAN
MHQRVSHFSAARVYSFINFLLFYFLNSLSFTVFFL